MRRLAPWLLLAACGTSGNALKEAEKGRPDAEALVLETVVRAQTARLVLSDYWRKEAKLEAASVTAKDAAQLARGNVVFTVRGLRIEAAESLEVRWQSDPEHDSILLDAKQVRLFHQKRSTRPYLIENATAVVMANDQISFFQQ